MRIVASAPMRIGLLGGGTDVDPFAKKHGGKVLSIAVNLLHTGVLVPNKDGIVRIKAMGEERELALGKRLVYGRDPKFDLIYAVINYFLDKIPGGFKYNDFIDAKYSSGLGSSGSAAVSMIGALAKWCDIKLSRREIAKLAWEMEAKELGWVGGKQDQFASAFGGINLFSFGPGEKVGVKPLKLDSETNKEIGKWVLLCFLPGKRHSAELQKKLREGMEDKGKQKALAKLRDSVEVGSKAIKKRDWESLGAVIDQAWEQKKRSNPEVTNVRIERIYKIAKDSGAMGGKVMGAGGVGHMFFFVSPAYRENLKHKLIESNLEIVPFDIDFQGLKVDRYQGKLKKSHRVDIRKGFSGKKNTPVVFLDRDGVVSVEKHLVHKLKDFELIPGAVGAIGLLNDNEIPVVVYHNASVVARGICEEGQVVKLHEKMKRLLAKDGAFVDVILFCPHHASAFNTRYEYDCDWRKPKYGMLKFAGEKFGLNFKKSFVVGDTARDIEMGKLAGATSILVQTGHAGQDTIYEAKPHKIVKDISEAVSFILRKVK